MRRFLGGCFAALGVAVFAFGAQAADAEVTDIRAGVHGLATRIVVDLDRPVTARVFTLTGPARLVVDLPEVGWRLPPEPLPAGIGVLSRLRYGLFKPGNSRVVVDLNQPARIHAAVALPAAGDYPNRLVIDLARSSGTDFLAQTSAGPMLIEAVEGKITRAEPEAQPEPVRSTPKPAVAKPIKAAAPAKPAVAEAPTVRQAGGNVKLASLRIPVKPDRAAGPKVRTVVIDPGHGGIDPGAIGLSGIYEKHITLAAAREIKARLEATGHYRVMLTRDRDIFIALRDRMEFARENKADLFVSLHADTIRDKGVRGLSVYTLSEKASDREAAELAERENKVDILAGVDLSNASAEVSDILIDLAQRETMNQSSKFANSLVDELTRSVKVLRNPHRFAGFVVLKSPDVPSVLIEMGFLSNPDDEKALRSPQHRRKFADAIAGAVGGYFRAVESASRP